MNIKPSCDIQNEPAQTVEELDRKIAALRAGMSKESLAEVDLATQILERVKRFLGDVAEAVLKDRDSLWLRWDEVLKVSKDHKLQLILPGGMVPDEMVGEAVKQYLGMVPGARKGNCIVLGYILEDEGKSIVMLRFYRERERKKGTPAKAIQQENSKSASAI
jgi:hypothetical protein